MKKIASLPIALAAFLIGCAGFQGESEINLGDDQNANAGDQVTIAGEILDLSLAYSTDFVGFTIDFDLDSPAGSDITDANVTQSGPIFIFTPDIAGEYYFYAWVYDNSNPSNIGVDVVKITVAAAA